MVRTATQIPEQLAHLTRAIPSAFDGVALKHLVDITTRRRLRRFGYSEPATDKAIEHPVVGLGTQGAFNGTPVILIERNLLINGLPHENKVAHEVGTGKIFARRVHRLENELRIILALSERYRHNLQAAKTTPYQAHAV